MDDTNTDPGEKLEAGAEALEGQESIEDVDFADMVSDVPAGRPDYNAWRSDAKSKLVAAGMDEEAAHLQAYEKSRESTMRLVDRLGSPVSSGNAGPQSGDPSGSTSQGSGASESEGQGGDGRSATSSDGEVERLRAEVAALRQDYVVQTADQKKAEMKRVRAELASGAYPELQNRAEVSKLKPRIKSLLDSHATQGNYGEAVKLAAFLEYGVRATGEGAEDGGSTTDTVDTSVPAPTRVNKPGRRAASPAQVRDRIADMVFNNRPADEVLDFADEQRQRGYR